MMKLLEFVGGVLLFSAVGILLAFIGINWVLNCQTWDESLWTEASSCLTPSQILEGVKIWLNKS